LAASLIEGIGDSCVQFASNTVALNGVKLSDDLRKLLPELLFACSGANEQAIRAFLNKDISLAENVRNLREKIESTYSSIEQLAKDSSVDLMPQILSAVSFLRQIYERSVDMADLVV
jgi:phosphate uptake regulator